MNYQNARFLKSAPTLQDCPHDIGSEVAFTGRSNAGKSSALNCLTGNKKLARTSKSPGRTQLINFFNINSRFRENDDKDRRNGKEERENNRKQNTYYRLVDLPGYGFAKVPTAIKHAWQHHLENYLRHRQSLRGLILLMDVRHPLQPFDKILLSWANSSELAVHILLTKADKLSRSAAKSTWLQVQKQLMPFEEQVSLQLFSSLNHTGLDELVAKLDEWFLNSPSSLHETE